MTKQNDGGPAFSSIPKIRETTAWTDEQILEVLHMRDHEGLSAREIAIKTDRTKNSVIGLWNRIRENEDDGTIGDGTMPPRWWERKQ